MIQFFDEGVRGFFHQMILEIFTRWSRQIHYTLYFNTLLITSCKPLTRFKVYLNVFFSYIHVHTLK